MNDLVASVRSSIDFKIEAHRDPCRPGLVPATISTAGSPGFRKESNAGPCQPARFRALTRPVSGDSVLQVVDMRDTAIGGERNYAIAHDLACPPGHLVNRIGAPDGPAIALVVASKFGFFVGDAHRERDS